VPRCRRRIRHGPRLPLEVNTTIGRAPDNDVVLPYPTISWNHAVVSWRDGVVAVRDLGSRNGTLVGVEKVRYRELVEGDVIAIADRMVFKLVNLAADAVVGRALRSPHDRDPFTGTANVMSLLDRLRIEQSLPQENDLPMILTFFRVGGLAELDEDATVEKAMNKTARAIQKGMRCEVVLARSGYDEFIALSRTVLSLAREMANRARIEVANPAGWLNWRRSRSFTLAAAIVPVVPTPASSAEEVLTIACAHAQAALAKVGNDVVVLAPSGSEDGRSSSS
jgi:pSer/pThr/pTyr-binding forkhead associated (FHA) protein